MEIKGLRLHRADGTVDTYDFPVTKIYVNADGSTSGNTGGSSSGDTGTTNRIYVYRSGDEDFVNCNYSLGEYMRKSQNQDGSVAVTYYSNPETCPSTINYFDLGMNTTFAGYSKLYIEASGVGAKCGYYNVDEAPEEGDMVMGTQYVLTDMSPTRAVYEHDVSECINSRNVSFMLYDGYPVNIYNIWLEK